MATYLNANIGSKIRNVLILFNIENQFQPSLWTYNIEMQSVIAYVEIE